jgi:YgiT-type zinc finger domain-containing protein
MKQDIVTQIFLIEGKPVIIEDIPAKICVRCEEAIFDISTAEKIRLMIHGNARPKKSVMADIFEFAA